MYICICIRNTLCFELDGACKFDALSSELKKNGMKACAITDHGVLFGLVQFYEAMSKADIKPILGCEVYVSERTRFDKVARVDDEPYHFVLLAENYEGYKNLLKLSSKAFTEGFYYKPRVDKDLLREHKEGLIALSACMAGEVSRQLMKGNFKAAEDAALEYKDIYGKDNFFLEIQSYGSKEQEDLNREIVKIARKHDMPIVATNDVHYVKKSDAKFHDVLLCVQTGATVNERDRMRFPTEEFYLKSGEEMEERFSWALDALENTVKIAERCDVKLDFDTIHLPEFPVPNGGNIAFYMREKCYQGLHEKFGILVAQDVRDRLEYELGVIEKMGYCGYFLIVSDFVDFAKSKGIYVGPGRGSAPGSLASYCLGITSIDPIKYDLIFERFLNPERVTMPDIDMDFCYERRGEVIDYVIQKYGVDHVAQIITFGTLAARASIRDVGRAMDIPYADVDKVAKLIPYEINMTIKKAIEMVAELRSMMDSPNIKELLEMAMAVEGLPRHSSVHAAGVVISKDPLTEHVPLFMSSDKVLTTQYPMEDLEKLNILKMDFLGLRTLTVIGKTVEMVNEALGENLDIESIPLDDVDVYKMLSNADSSGVFQLESSLFQNLLREIKPSRFEDIIAIIALGRPGPMMMTGDFVSGKHGGMVKYLHPKLEPILKSTYGVMLYQEQVMRTASELAGFSLAEADLLRRAMGKKKAEIIEGLKNKFITGAVERDIPEKTAKDIFSLIERFAGYGFNAAHSAAYGMISYRTAYLRCKYFKYFMAATISSVSGYGDKVAWYIESCKAHNVAVLPPDVNESNVDFTVVDGGIRFGIAAVKGVGNSTAEAIVEERKKGKFTSLEDFCDRVGMSVVNKKALEHLIKSGSMASLGNRRALLSILENVADASQRKEKQASYGQMSFFDIFENPQEFAKDVITLPNIEEHEKHRILAWEKEYLGLYLSGHPLTEHAEYISKVSSTTTAKLKNYKDDDIVILAGMIIGKKQISTKRGQLMAFLQFEDLEGQVEVVVFPTIYEKASSFLHEDSLVSIKGKINIKDEEVKILAELVTPFPTNKIDFM